MNRVYVRGFVLQIVPSMILARVKECAISLPVCFYNSPEISGLDYYPISYFITKLTKRPGT